MFCTPFQRKGLTFVKVTKAECGEPLDCFFAFAYWNGHFWSAHRRHVMHPPDAWPEPAQYSSRIHVTQWREDEEGLHPIWSVDIGAGNDPRITLVDEKAIVLFRGAINSEHEYYLYDIGDDRLVPITLPSSITFGKNWAPFATQGKLGALHGFDPIHMLEIDCSTGSATLFSVRTNPFSARAGHDNYSILRGGSNAINLGQHLLGFGHSTSAPYSHYPFLWRLSADGNLSIVFDMQFEPLSKAGFSIIDPTCLVIAEKRSFVGLCCSERDWFYDQSFTEILLPVDLNTEHFGAPVIDTSEVDRLSLFVLLPAERLPSQISTTPVPYGAKYSEGIAGFLTFGPYRKVPSGEYEVIYRYRAKAPRGALCGWVDICVSSLREVKQLTRIDLTGTDGEILKLSLTTVIEMDEDEVMETRVFTDGVCGITLYDICIRSE